MPTSKKGDWGLIDHDLWALALGPQSSLLQQRFLVTRKSRCPFCHVMHGICRDAPSLTAHFHVCTACGRPGHSVQACSEAESGGSSWSGWRANHVVPGGKSCGPRWFILG